MAQILIEIRAKGDETLNPFLLSKLIEARIGKISNAKRNKDSIILEANEDAISKINGQKINIISKMRPRDTNTLTNPKAQSTPQVSTMSRQRKLKKN